MYEFQVTIHARPVAAAPGPQLNLKGRDVQTLAISPEVVGATKMDRTFEAASEALASLERMYCEPDGSFVWVSSQAEDPWQVDGNLYDRNERLLFVDLKGSCPGSRFDELLKALGWPQTALVFQLTRQAVFLDEAEFRRFAETSES
jgi:hypothetical protein